MFSHFQTASMSDFFSVLPELRFGALSGSPLFGKLSLELHDAITERLQVPVRFRYTCTRRQVRIRIRTEPIP